MKRPVSCVALLLFFAVLSFGTLPALAGSIIIHNGATLTPNGSTIDLNCQDLTVEDGGTFNLNSGAVSECGNLIVESGGFLIQGSGTISYCTPTVTTEAVTGIGTTTATGNGTITDLGVSNPTAHGVCWNTTGAPTLADDSTDEGAAGTTGTFTSAMTGLSPNTTYYVRAYAANTEGTAYGNEVSFSTAAAAVAPTATTRAASGVDDTTATLNGTVNANGASTTVAFEYGTDTSYGTTVTADQSPVDGFTDRAASKIITGLTTGTTYHYRVVATNVNGTTNGADMTFTPGATPPMATTQATTAVGTQAATLNGIVNANNDSTTVTFEYGETAAYGSSADADQSPVSGTTDTIVSATITGLTEGVTYHYRVVATNASGTTTGADMTFTTGVTPPTAISQAATAVGTTTVTLNGTVNANGTSTTVTFQYGETTAYGATANAVQSPVSGTTDTAVSAAICGLTAGTTYHYRVVAQNGGGATYGTDLTFTTGTMPPTVTTQAATAVGTTTATLNGIVNANGASTVVSFQCGTTVEYGRTITASQSPVTGSSNTAVSAAMDTLTPNTLYHYRVCAVNGTGTTYGADMTFTTNPLGAPTVTTTTVSDITMTTATSGGTVTEEGNAPVTARGVCWGTSSGPTIDDSITSNGTGTGAFTSDLAGLSPLTTYYVRAYATNTIGTSYGDAMQFPTDDDGTGVEPETQAAGPNGGDGNGDGMQDNLQRTVASLPSATGTGYLTVEISGCDQIEQVRAVTYDSVGLIDPGYAYPFGLLKFEIPCSPVTVRIYYHSAETLEGYRYRKFGPTPNNWSRSIWYTLPEVTFGTALIGGQTVCYAEFILTAGQLGDDTDGLSIIDQGGPGLFDPYAVPVFSAWGMMLFTLLVAGAAIVCVRRKSHMTV